MWLMVGVAAGMLVIIVLTGHRSRCRVSRRLPPRHN